MKRSHLWITGACLTLILAASAVGLSRAEGKALVMANADLKWKEMGVPGVSAAVVEGDMAKGASRFYLKYPVGLVTPAHHHSADHYVTTISGTLILTVDGKDHRLPPGSYFALTGKEPHIARVEGDKDCVLFVDARGPWDVVPEK